MHWTQLCTWDYTHMWHEIWVKIFSYFSLYWYYESIQRKILIRRHFYDDLLLNWYETNEKAHELFFHCYPNSTLSLSLFNRRQAKTSRSICVVLGPYTSHISWTNINMDLFILRHKAWLGFPPSQALESPWYDSQFSEDRSRSDIRFGGNGSRFYCVRDIGLE